MKVLQINVLVDSGSTGKIVRDIDNVLIEKGIDSIICYGRKNTNNKARTYKFCTEAEAAIQKVFNRVGLSLMYGGNYWSTKRLIKRIKTEKPDIVHVHCINGYCVNIYRLFNYLADADIKTVITHHAEFFYTGNCGHAFECPKFYNDCECKGCELSTESPVNVRKWMPHKSWKKMHESIHRFKPGSLHFTAVSPWIKERSQLSPIVQGYPCSVVMNGVDTSIFYNRKDTESVKSRLPKSNGKIIFHATASFSDKPNLKGGNYIIELAKLMPDHTFIVASNYCDINIELPSNLVLWGRTKDQNELAQLYSIANLTVITSQRETFSMVVAESLCCGTPVVGFKAGGPESIALNAYSQFVSYGNSKSLAQTITEFLEFTTDASIISNDGDELYSKERMAQNYLNVYKQLLS